MKDIDRRSADVGSAGKHGADPGEMLLPNVLPGVEESRQKTGIGVWYAPEDMRGGRKNVDQIDQAIRVHDKLLLALSKASMASDWVTYEIMRAVEREKQEKRQVLFPIGIASRKAIMAWSAFDSDSGKDIAKVVREYHIPDFSNWKDYDSFEAAFARLLDDLKAEKSAGVDAPTARPSRLKKPR
jgi:hypothetical protein